MFKILDTIWMFFDRKYFCKEELKNKKCNRVKKECCMYKHVCKL